VLLKQLIASKQRLLKGMFVSCSLDVALNTADPLKDAVALRKLLKQLTLKLAELVGAEREQLGPISRNFDFRRGDLPLQVP